jgi:hypothetical protein
LAAIDIVTPPANPVAVFPSASRAVTTIAGEIVTPAAAGLGWVVKTSWVAGPGVTVMLAVPLLPSLIALIVADPGNTPVTRPLLLTVATAGASLDQPIPRPVN